MGDGTTSGDDIRSALSAAITSTEENAAKAAEAEKARETARTAREAGADEQAEIGATGTQRDTATAGERPRGADGKFLPKDEQAALAAAETKPKPEEKPAAQTETKPAAAATEPKPTEPPANWSDADKDNVAICLSCGRVA